MTNHIHSRSLASELPRPRLCAGWDFTGVLRDATPQCSFDYLNAQIRIDSGEGVVDCCSSACCAFSAAVQSCTVAGIPATVEGAVLTESSSTVVTDGLREYWV